MYIISLLLVDWLQYKEIGFTSLKIKFVANTNGDKLRIFTNWECYLACTLFLYKHMSWHGSWPDMLKSYKINQFRVEISNYVSHSTYA